MKDHISDTSLQLFHSLSQQFLPESLPEYVKSANLENEKPGDEYPDSVYADKVRCSFPCHSKVATYVSALYYHGQRANGQAWDSPMPANTFEDRLEKAARCFGILPEIEAMRNSISEKSAAADRELGPEDYALNVKYGDETISRFPVVSQASVIKSAEALCRDKACYPYAWRKEAARNIMKQARALDADIPLEHLDYLVKASGCYVAPHDKIANDLYDRSAVLPDEDSKALRKVASAIHQGHQGDVGSLCNMIDNLDRHHKKYSMYNHGMPMPEEICYAGLPEKAASNDNIVTLTTGTSYDLESIKSAGIEPFAAIGDAYVSELAAGDQGDVDIEKVAAVLPTLPRDDAAILDQAFSAVGVSPIDSEKAASAAMNIFDKDEWTREARERGLAASEDFRMAVPLVHNQDVHKSAEEKSTV